MSKSVKKFRDNLREATHLNAYFILKDYEENKYLDVICTLIAVDLQDGNISEDMVDHIPKLIRQIKEELTYFMEHLKDKVNDG